LAIDERKRISPRITRITWIEETDRNGKSHPQISQTCPALPGYADWKRREDKKKILNAEDAKGAEKKRERGRS